MTFDKNFPDLFNLMLHRAVAEKLRRDESAVLRIARGNLERWLGSESFAGNGRAALVEWREILENKSAAEIIGIITQETDEGQRLRSSSPFAGVLTETEREEIWSECAEIRPV
jgi:hypothetical protein